MPVASALAVAETVAAARVVDSAAVQMAAPVADIDAAANDALSVPATNDCPVAVMVAAWVYWTAPIGALPIARLRGCCWTNEPLARAIAAPETDAAPETVADPIAGAAADAVIDAAPETDAEAVASALAVAEAHAEPAIVAEPVARADAVADVVSDANGREQDAVAVASPVDVIMAGPTVAVPMAVSMAADTALRLNWPRVMLAVPVARAWPEADTPNEPEIAALAEQILRPEADIVAASSAATNVPPEAAVAVAVMVVTEIV